MIIIIIIEAASSASDLISRVWYSNVAPAPKLWTWPSSNLEEGKGEMGDNLVEETTDHKVRWWTSINRHGEGEGEGVQKKKT